MHISIMMQNEEFLLLNGSFSGWGVAFWFDSQMGQPGRVDANLVEALTDQIKMVRGSSLRPCFQIKNKMHNF
jgi:hypothetical protein